MNVDFRIPVGSEFPLGKFTQLCLQMKFQKEKKRVKEISSTVLNFEYANSKIIPTKFSSLQPTSQMLLRSLRLLHMYATQVPFHSRES